MSDEHFTFLDNLKSSGTIYITNYRKALRAKYKLTHKQSTLIVSKWLEKQTKNKFI